MDRSEQSQVLHVKVRQFADWALAEAQDAAQERQRFTDLASEIAEFQAEHCAAVSRLVGVGTPPNSAALKGRVVPAVPSDVFRLTRVACHPPELDGARFHTSGTSAKHTGWHYLRTLATYRALSTAFGRKALLGERPCATVIALMASPRETPHSSLATMCEFFMEDLDGRALPGEAASEPYSRRSSRWLLSGGAINVVGLRRAIEAANARGEIVLLLATSLALALLVQQLRGERIVLPAGSIVMQTGGSKGRSIEFNPEELRAHTAEFFGIGESQIIGEYGMTELCSQLYEGTLWHEAARPGVYFAPPWLQVTPVDPVTQLPVPEGEVGLAQFIDLANVDSSICVLTQDLIRREGGGVRLLGRQPRSPSRGCSLLVEHLLTTLPAT
jgi:hypothetical protein